MALTQSLRSLVSACGILGFSTGFVMAQSNDLPLGQPVEPQPGDTYVAEEFGDWQIRCVLQEPDVPEPCQMYQLLLDVNGTSVAEMTAFALPEGQAAVAGATVITPLETHLASGVQFFVDDQEPLLYGFDFCSRMGCYARMGWTQDLVTSMEQGAVATIRIAPYADPQSDVIVTASLRGFTAAMNSMRQRLEAASQ